VITVYNLDSKSTPTSLVALTCFILILSCCQPIKASSAHSTTPSTNLSTSSLVFPACKHTLTRSFPFGTVGHVIGRAFMPSVRRNAERGRGWDVMIGIIGEERSRAVAQSEGSGHWRCAGRERSSGGTEMRRGRRICMK